jgi:hypothetical protein
MRGAEAMGQGINQGLNQFGAGLGQHLERLKEEKKEADTLRGFLKSAPGSTDPDYKTKIDALSLPKLRQQATEVRSKLEMEQAELDREAKLLQISRIKDEMSRMNRQDAALAELPALFNQAQGDVIAGTENINPPNLMPVVAKLAQAGYKPDDIDGIMRVMQAGGQSQDGPATIREIFPGIGVVEKRGSKAFQLVDLATGAVTVYDEYGNRIGAKVGRKLVEAPDRAEQEKTAATTAATKSEAIGKLEDNVAAAERSIAQLQSRLAQPKNLATGKPYTAQDRANIERQIQSRQRALVGFMSQLDNLYAEYDGDGSPAEPEKPAKPASTNGVGVFIRDEKTGKLRRK